MICTKYSAGMEAYMRKKLLSLVLAAAMVFGMTGCDSAISSESKSDSGDKSDTIKVGVLLSTTGDFSISETPMKNCAQMAIDEINEKGGINGKKIKAIYSDYGSDPSMAAEKAQELILNDKVCAIVGTNSTSTRLSVEPIIEKYDNLLVYNTFYEGEIYLAVVESELDILSDMMKRVAEKNISPDEKLLEMIYTRLDAVKEVVYRNGTLRAYFFRDIWRVEKVRKKFDAKEVQLFKAVLLEGQAKGVFHIDDVEMTADLIHYCVKGIEVPYIRGHIGAHLDEDTRNRYVSNIVFGALHRTEI